MHCWFCESPLASGPAGPYCLFAACPACKELAPAYALLDGREPEWWRRLRESGQLGRNLAEAGLPAG